MPITVTPTPVSLAWSNFSAVRALTNGEDAHIDVGFDLQNKPLRKVGTHWMLAEDIELKVRPQARVLRTANQTADLLAHEQGHYDIGILVGRALAADLQALSEATPAALVKAATAAFDLHRLTRMGAIQKAYDDDTKHSQDTKEQARWAGLISAALAAAGATAVNNLTL